MLTLINTITATGMFWLYGVFGEIGLLFFYRIVPETKGKSLEEVEAELLQRVPVGPEGAGAGRTTS